MDIRLVAKTYIDAGWAVVPLVKGEKRAASAWQKRVYAPKDFGPDDGLAGKCGEPSGWRVDVDCDAPEAVAAAKLLLPATGLVHGRPGKPDSHYWFVVEGAKTTQFTDIVNPAGLSGMLIEIRSTGGYTALPPSAHPSGDVLAWTVERDPMVLTPEELHGAVRAVAVAALLARHWPGPGARHAAVGPLAGFLLQAKLAPLEVLEIIRTAATVAGDADLDDRLTYARSTCDKHAAGDKVTGGPRLADALGDAVVAKLRSWLRLEDTDALDRFNAVHFVVTMGKDAVIGREDHPDGVVFQHPRALDIEYANQRIAVGTDAKGKPRMQPAFRAWLESAGRRSYRRVVFAPPPHPCDPSDYNLWRGYAVEPSGTPADAEPFLDHLHGVICAGDDGVFRYLLNLLALTVQRPGEPSQVATVLRGKPGTGKGVFVRTIGDLFGRRHYAHLDKVDQLAGHFNAALSGKIIVFADEAFWAGDKREVGALKRLITEPTLHIVRKGIDGVDEANHVHLFMATNESWAFPAMMHERRALILEVADVHMQDHVYFDRLHQRLHKPALLKYLLEWPVDRVVLKHLPKTKELREQQNRSLGPLEEWWLDCLWSGSLGSGITSWPGGEWVPVQRLFSAYLDWAQARRLRVASHVTFGMQLNAFFSGEKSKPRKIKSDVLRCVQLRTLSDARAYFDSVIGSQGEWPEELTPSSTPSAF